MMSPDRNEREGSKEREKERDCERETEGDEYYGKLARETHRKVLGGKDESSPSEREDTYEGSEVEEGAWEREPHPEEDYSRLARETYWRVRGKERDERSPERVTGRTGSLVNAEAGEVSRNLERNDEDLFEVRRCLSGEDFRRAAPKVRGQVLEHYHRFLDSREEILRKLKPDTFSEPDFRDRCLNDKTKLAEVRRFLDSAEGSNLPEREPEKYEEAWNRYEKLLNKRYYTLAGIEPKPKPPERALRRKDSKPEPEKRLRFARRYIPEPAAARRKDSKPESAFDITREGWVQKEGDEKSVVNRAAVSGERDGARFKQTVQTVRSESPIGDTLKFTNSTEVRAEKKVKVTEDSVRRIWWELSNTREAFVTRADRPYAGVLEPEKVDGSRTVTVVDRGERKWLKNVDYAAKTEKWWVNEEGVMCYEQCMQAIGHRKTKKGETDIWGAAVTDRFRFGEEKDEKISGETTFIQFDPRTTVKRGEAEKQRSESKTSLENGTEAINEGRQETVLKFYQNEGDETPRNAHVEQVCYKIIHESPEETGTNTVEKVEGTNENDGVAENFEEPDASAVETVEELNEAESEVVNSEEKATSTNGIVETTEPTDITQERTTQSKQVVEGDLIPEYSSEKFENENQAGERVVESSESSRESVSDSEELRFEDVFILVEGRERRRLSSVLGVLRVFVEGIRKNGGDEERYCEELRKRGAPKWLHGWLLRQMVYERRIPEEVLHTALEYLGKDVERELDSDERVLEVTGEGSEATLRLMVCGRVKSLGLEERLRCIYSEDAGEGRRAKSARLKFLEELLRKGDLYYVLELVVTGLLRGLIEDGEAVTMEEALEEDALYCETLLKRVVKILLSERIEKLIDDEAQTILEAAIERYAIETVMETYYELVLEQVMKTQLDEGKIQSGIEPLSEAIKTVKQSTKKDVPSVSTPNTQGKMNAMSRLAEEVGIMPETLRSYIDWTYRKRSRMTREVYLKICDVLSLPPSIRVNKRVNRKDLLEVLLRAEQELVQEEQGSLSPDELALLPWYELPSGIYSFFDNDNLKELRNVALERCSGKMTRLTKKLQKVGFKHAHRSTPNRIARSKTHDAELILALIGVVTGQPLRKVRELARNGKLAKEFMVEELRLKDLDEETMLNLPRREVNRLKNKMNEKKKLEERILTPEELKRLRSEKGLSKSKLAEKADVDRETIQLIERGSSNPPLSIQLKILNALRDENEGKIKLKEVKNERLYDYVARKLNEHLKKEEKVDYTIIKALVDKVPRISKKLYLLACEVLGLEPCPSLRSRRIMKHSPYLRTIVYEVDFPTPIEYKNSSGKTVEIRENDKGFFIINPEGKKLRAIKRKTRYGGKWWGLTIIDYETEEGIYTLIKEAGELWPPLVTPWYILPLDLDIRFKTFQTLKELVCKLKETLPLLKNEDLAKIMGMSTETLSKLKGGQTKNITLGHLLTLIALKSTVNQTSIKSEILKFEQEIDTIEEDKLPERKENMLYINLKTPFGATLIGHELGDGWLFCVDERTFKLGYLNTKLTLVQSVSELLKIYGSQHNISTKEGSVVDDTKYKDQHIVVKGGLLAYALWRAIPQAFGKKTKGNPKVSSEIVKDPRLAPFLAQAIIKDESYEDPEKKSMTVEMYVDVTKKLKDRKQEVRAIAEEQVRELEKDKGRKLIHKEDLAAHHVALKKVSEETKELAKTVPCNILLSLKEALETSKINFTWRSMCHFHVSKKGDVTASSKIYLPKNEAEKTYEYGLLTELGQKEEPYKLLCKHATRRLVDPEKKVEKPSKEQVTKQRKNMKNTAKKEKKERKH